MTSQNADENIAQNQGKHAAAPQPLTKREQRRAQKAAKRAADEAAKQAKRAAKAAQKAAKQGGVVSAATIAAASGSSVSASAEPVSHPVDAVLPETPAVVETAAKHAAAPVEVPAAEAAAPAVEAAAQNPLRHLPSTLPLADAAGPASMAAEPPASEAAAPVERVHVGPTEQFADASQYAEGETAFTPASDVDAFNQYSRYTVEQGEGLAPKRKKNRGKVAVAIIVVLACLLGAGFAGANMYLENLNKNLAGDEQEAEEIKEVLTPVPLGDDPFYMLLMGCDDREGVDGARTDTTILARLDPKKNIVTLMSIPRDTAIDLEGYGTQKFNAAYTYGGPSGTIEATKQLCGVDISHYAEVHFEALIDIIDYIGGVDVDVPIAIDDVDAGGKVDAGMQHLDGEHAMIFARSRSYVNGDFQRTTSQRLLIEAAVNKMLSMDATEYPGLLMKISECMNTDFSVQELLGLAQAFTDEPELTMYSTMVPSTTADIDGVSYVVTDINTLAELMAVIDKGGDPATVEFEDTTVTTSKEAEEQGIEVIPNAGDDVVDGYYDYNYYDPNFSYDYYGAYQEQVYEEPVYDEGYVDEGSDDSGEVADDGGYEEAGDVVDDGGYDGGEDDFGDGYEGE